MALYGRAVTRSTTLTQGVATTVNAKAVAAWSASCLVIVLGTSNPGYKTVVLSAAFTSVAATVGLARMRRLLIAVALVAASAVLLNFVSVHLGRTVLFALPESIPGVGGPYTVEALAFGASGGITIAAAILAAAPFSLLLQPYEVMDALPRAFSRTGTTIAASMNLVPTVVASFTEVSEAQRMRGWRPRGPRSWAEVVVPVVLTSVESSIQLAESMEARGFGLPARTHFGATKLGPTSLVVIATAVTAAAGFVTAEVVGWALPWYPYPSLAWPALDLRVLAACSLLFVPVVLWRRRG